MNRALAQDAIAGECGDCPTGSAARGLVMGFGFSMVLWGGLAWAVAQVAGM
jgi:hypothetical protein